jgi:uncharacterized protein
MKKLLEFILNKIIDDDSQIQVEEKTEENNAVSLVVIAPKEKIGYIVGKNGRIIQAIRNIIKIFAVKNNQLLLNIKVEEKI